MPSDDVGALLRWARTKGFDPADWPAQAARPRPTDTKAEEKPKEK